MVQFKSCVLMSILLVCSASAKLYYQVEIEEINNNVDVLISNKKFVNKFFTSKKPQAFIKNFINNNAKINDSLKIEYKLFTLLDEISYQPKQVFLQEFVDIMKNYQQKAETTHAEGNLIIPVYRLNTKAKGIENIWLANDSLTKYQNLFNVDPISMLMDLKYNLDTLSQPEWFGLKRSINDITVENHIIISDFLLQNSNNMQGLDKFVSRYALMTSNQELITSGIKYLNLSNREYLLRQISKYFAEDFVVAQLENAIKSNKSRAFAMTLLKPYSARQDVQNFLINSLSDKQLASQAAFVLSQTRQLDTLKKLETIYLDSQSPQQRQQIVFILKLNQQNMSKDILQNLEIKDESSKTWLAKFKRSVK